ncbi:protein canopy homolog 2 isoform X1 [Eleutherodactylus coqui]|uniref:protein canopy homolog 2 isoform X1 n=1 Tax=Eleutherodactylus coqui TaxID=57060 RepID=UPI003462CC51
MVIPTSHWLLLALILVPFFSCTVARRGQDVHCGACRALVDEMEWEISQVDPKKTIQKGSFRINPDGTQSITEVPYARTEAHLMELLERVCENMKAYGERIDPETHRKSYVRVLSRDGKTMDASNTNIDKAVISDLKFTQFYLSGPLNRSAMEHYIGGGSDLNSLHLLAVGTGEPSRRLAVRIIRLYFAWHPIYTHARFGPIVHVF